MQTQFASQMWAARPHLGSIFEKLLHRKTFHNNGAVNRKQTDAAVFCECPKDTARQISGILSEQLQDFDHELSEKNQ